MSRYTLSDLIGRKVVGIIDAKEDMGILFEGGLCVLADAREPVYAPDEMIARVEMELQELSPQGKRISQLNKDKTFLNKYIKKDDDGKAKGSKPGAEEPAPVAGSVEVKTRENSGDNEDGGQVPGGIQELQHEIKPPSSSGDPGDGLL